MNSSVENNDLTVSATVNYVAMDGGHVSDLNTLSQWLDDIALIAEKDAGTVKGKGQAALIEAAERIRGMIPDMEAMPPEPDPVAEAQVLLWEETQKAQELLRTEAKRQREESAIREAFGIPGDLLSSMVEAITASPGAGDAAYKAAEEVLEDAGWCVYARFGTPRPGYLNGREPFRKLAELREKFPVHHLTPQVEEVLSLALEWCRASSLNGGNATVPEGVTYPYISVELMPFPPRGDVSKGYRQYRSVVINPAPDGAQATKEAV